MVESPRSRKTTKLYKSVKLGHDINGAFCPSFDIEAEAWLAVKNRQKPLLARDVLLLDGTNPVPGKPIICGTCSMELTPKNIRAL